MDVHLIISGDHSSPCFPSSLGPQVFPESGGPLLSAVPLPLCPLPGSSCPALLWSPGNVCTQLCLGSPVLSPLQNAQLLLPQLTGDSHFQEIVSACHHATMWPLVRGRARAKSVVEEGRGQEAWLLRLTLQQMIWEMLLASRPGSSCCV